MGVVPGQPERRSMWPWVVLALVVLAGLAIVGYFLLSNGEGSGGTGSGTNGGGGGLYGFALMLSADATRRMWSRTRRAL
jgi:hypothetical protein